MDNTYKIKKPAIVEYSILQNQQFQVVKKIKCVFYLLKSQLAEQKKIIHRFTGFLKRFLKSCRYPNWKDC